MIYLDVPSRALIKVDLATFYDSATATKAVLAALIVDHTAVAQRWVWTPPRITRPLGLRIFSTTLGKPPSGSPH